MRHLGDITKLSGWDMPPVDVIIGGSPCQDLSVAGKGAGLAGERSGLFLEQIRIVKEMRTADEQRGRTGQFIRPRFMVWENVPGAFSSHGGQDFRRVLEEVIRIAEPEAPDVPLPAKGKWPMADCWYGDGWSVAYRILDAQFWGVPQRRRRIALVADFGGHAAPEILFNRRSVCGYIAEGEETGQGTTAGTESGAGGAVYPSIARTLTARADSSPCVDRGMNIVVQSTEPLPFDTTQITSPQNGDHPHYGDPCHPLAAGAHPPAIVMATGQARAKVLAPPICCAGFNHKAGAKAGGIGYAPDCAPTLQAERQSGVLFYKKTQLTYGMARRLTPLECERLQDFPDGWTDIGEWTDSKGKLHKESSDSARYRALGNSIALPPWRWVLKRISALYERDATMGSLFDGIGGFPLIWEQFNGAGSCLWASEVDEFCIAVTKRRFGREVNK